MRNYLSAECYKAFRRKYFYIALAVCLGLELVLLGCYWLTMSWGNPTVSFGSTAVLVPMVLSVGLYAALITGDIVFSDQYKNNTLKNEVAYGIPRRRIYLGKLITAAGAGLLLVFLTLLVYAVLCRLFIPVGPEDWAPIQTFLFRLVSAVPLWLGSLALTMTAMFNIAHTIPMMALVLTVLMGLGPVFRGLIGLGVDWLSALAGALCRLTLTAPLDLAGVALWDPAHLLWCWGVGLLWTAGCTAVGLALFARRDIR